MSWQLTPPGGWKYKQGEFWIEAESFHQLVVAVTQHRLNNRIAVGDANKDVEDQLIKLHPQIELNVLK